MEKVVQRTQDRGGGDHGWLKTRYSFSFADWYDPTRMGFGVLRVINDDAIAPHQGFGAHSHRDMEIITLVTSGTLTHEDSLGNLGVVEEGEVQILSAGTGVVHGERNDGDKPLTLFQIWIEAKEKGIVPRYGQSDVGLGAQPPGFKLLVAPLGTPEALTINQDAYIYHGVIDSEHPLQFTPANLEHGIYLFVIEGEIRAEGETLYARDALGLTGAGILPIESDSPSRFLLFEVPMHAPAGR